MHYRLMPSSHTATDSPSEVDSAVLVQLLLGVLLMAFIIAAPSVHRGVAEVGDATAMLL